MEAMPEPDPDRYRALVEALRATLAPAVARLKPEDEMALRYHLEPHPNNGAAADHEQ